MICYALLFNIKRHCLAVGLKMACMFHSSFFFFLHRSNVPEIILKVYRKFFASDNNSAILIDSTTGTCKKKIITKMQISTPYCKRLFVYIFEHCDALCNDQGSTATRGNSYLNSELVRTDHLN